MGIFHGKQSKNQSLSFLHDFSATSGMPMAEVVGHCKEWMEKNPTGKMGKKCFLNYMGKAFPDFSKEEIDKIGEHTFRVFDSNGDGEMDFLEFMIVYNLMSKKEPKAILNKIFDIFDIDRDNMITKNEMERVVTDLSILFKDPTNGKECFAKTFAEMDENEDNKITRDEFVSAILDDNKYSQCLAMGVLDLFMD